MHKYNLKGGQKKRDLIQQPPKIMEYQKKNSDQPPSHSQPSNSWPKIKKYNIYLYSRPSAGSTTRTIFVLFLSEKW